MSLCESSLTDKASDIQGTRKNVAQKIGFGAVLQAKPGRAFELSSFLIGIATFSIAETANAQRPGGRMDIQIASETNATIRERKSNGDRKAQGAVRVTIRTRDRRVRVVRGRVRNDIGSRAREAVLTTKPFGGTTLVVVTVEREAVAMRT